VDIVDFSGRSLDVATDELFCAGLPLAADGFGKLLGRRRRHGWERVFAYRRPERRRGLLRRYGRLQHDRERRAT
jgi:hypothetical protein